MKELATGMEQKSLTSQKRKAPNPKDGKLDPFSPSVVPALTRLRMIGSPWTNEPAMRRNKVQETPGCSVGEEEEEDFEDAVIQALVYGC